MYFLRKSISNQTSWHKNHKNILKQYVSKLSCSSGPSTLKQEEEEGVTAPHHRSFGSGRSKEPGNPKLLETTSAPGCSWRRRTAVCFPTVSSLYVKKTMQIHNLRAQGGHVEM